VARLFLSYADADAAYAQQLRTALDVRGYVVWQDAGYTDPRSASYPAMIEQAIVGSVALILIWDQAAAQTAWVERQILFAQRLKKPIFPILLDTTPLPNTLVSVTPVMGQSSGNDTARLLVALANFPLTQSSDLLYKFYELAAHDYIRERKHAIEMAEEMFKRDEHPDEVFAVLAYLAQHDLYMSVREKAEELIAAATTPASSTPSLSLGPDEARHVFGVRCKQGHVSFFDKRLVCSAHSQKFRQRVNRAGKTLDELYLSCTTCGEEIVAYVDCEGYQ
jgi:hypothetical protein